MASGGQPLDGKKISSNGNQSRNDSDTQWLLIPNNLELSGNAKPSKKQRNKDKHRHFHKENLTSPSEGADYVTTSKKRTSFHSFPVKSNAEAWLRDRFGNEDKSKQRAYDSEEELSGNTKPSKKQRNKDEHRHFRKENLSSPSEGADYVTTSKKRSSFHSFPVKSNAEAWLRDRFGNEDKSKQRAYDSEEVFSDSDFPQHSQQNIHFATNQAFSDIEHQEHQPPSSWGGAENENTKSVKDGFKKETAMVYEMLNNIQDFISEAESSWHILELTEEPVIKDAFIKLKNAVKDVEGGRETKRELMLQQAAENGFANDVSPSSSTSRVSNPKELSRESSGNALLCNDENTQDKCNQLFEVKGCERRTESISSDDCPIPDFGEQVAAVECERRKLKNKLVEVQEEWKLSEVQLNYLKDVANRDPNRVSGHGISAKEIPRYRKKKLGKEIGRLQVIAGQAKLAKELPTELNQNMTVGSGSSVSQSGSRPSRSSASIKRDNVRKEQNVSFPARRHYEAEGRANEDPDIPAAAAPVVSPAANNPELKEKIRQLKVAQEHVKVIKDIVVSILESRKSKALLDDDKLRLQAQMQKIDSCLSAEESDGDSDFRRDLSSAMHLINSESTATNVKEVYDSLKQISLDGDSHPPEETEVAAENLESSVIRKEDLSKLQSHLCQLMQIFPTADRISEDSVRSSGEGAYSQKKNPSKNVVPDTSQRIHARSVPRQDNLQLTRQNIVSMDSQNQNSNSNFHNRDCNSIKKDNINNLSGKMGKLSIQNSMNSSYPDVLTASNNNMDTMSTFSYELNQNHSLPNEVERKTILDILKRDKKKQKQYDQNRGCHVCCHSSVDSEPLEDSNSALAMDATVGAWGGSSTQENFEDENEEQGESLEEQDDEESFCAFDKGSIGGHGSAVQFSSQFSNMQHFIEGLPDDKGQRNFQQPLYNRNQNQPTMQAKFQQQHPTQRIKSRQPVSSNAATCLPKDVRENTACANEPSDHCSQHFPSKFIDQLKNQIDQLNALCQNQIFSDRPQTAINSHSSSYSHLHHTSSPLQPAPEIPIPDNQQLLLSLSQCYHALYMQQLEIHHLQRCIWHNIDGESPHQPNNLNVRNNHDDPTFRPYPIPPWSYPFNPSSHFLPEQMFPSPSAYFPSPIKPYATHANSYATSSASQPARAVIHPTSQNNAASQETLNNQVPPRTRANNFWDNFRSYSRQNLLSASNNTKRNENASSFVTPQVRQVYPLVTNESPKRKTDISDACCNTSSFSEYDRSVPNPEQVTTKNSRCNTSSGVASGFVASQKKDTPTSSSCISRNARSSRCNRTNLESSAVQPTQSSSATNLMHPPLPDNSNRMSSSVPSGTPKPEASCTNQAYELPKFGPIDKKSDYFLRLFYAAQALKSDALRQEALWMIRDLVVNESSENDDHLQARFHNEQSVPFVESERGPTPVSNQRCSKFLSEMTVQLPDIVDNEKSVCQGPSDNALGNIQNLPTAAIPPLSKHGTPKAVSTGAVRKKPKIRTAACFPEPASNELASSHDSSGNNDESPTVVPYKNVEVHKNVEIHVPGFVTEKVMYDLVTMLPSLKRRLHRDNCSQSFWTIIIDCLIESIIKHLFFCNITLSRKSLVNLRQTVYQFLSLFSGTSLSDIDSEFVKYVEEFIFENMTCFVRNGYFVPGPPTLDLEILEIDKMPELSPEIPIEPIEIEKLLPVETEEFVEPINLKPSKLQEESGCAVAVKMSPEEMISFSSQCGPILQQNLYNIDSLISEPSGELPPGSPVLGSLPMGDIRCDCNPEAEIEPEVETGTEADLAEADQSPGQQGTVGDNELIAENLPSEIEEVLIQRNSGTVLLMNVAPVDRKGLENGESTEGATGLEVTSDASLGEEVILLDDIPTKLCACASEEEVLQSVKQDQAVSDLPSEDVTFHDFESENDGYSSSGNPR